MSGNLLALLVVLALTAAGALWWRALQGRVTRASGGRFGREAVGAPPGVTLVVEFTAPGCAPCGQAEQVLAAAVEGRHDVVLVTADVGQHLDLVRAHGILRAPTTLVVDDQDRVRHRISGVPVPGDVEALLDGAVVGVHAA